MFLRQIHDPYLSQYAYLIGCPKSGDAVVIDPMRDIDTYEKIASENDLRIVAVAETHIHADFLSGSREFLENRGGVTAYLSKEGGKDWQYEWAADHKDARLLSDGETFSIGNVGFTVLHMPGHTPEHICFLVEDKNSGKGSPMAILSGDFMFVGSVGRPDLLESAAGEAGSQEKGAEDLFHSIRRFSEIPGHVLVLPAHGSGSSCGKQLGAVPFSSVGYELIANESVTTALGNGEEAFTEEILEGQPSPPMYFARMKKSNRSGPPLLGGLPQVSGINPEKLEAMVKGGDTVFVDVREDRRAFMESHVSGSLHAPMGPKFSEAVGSYLEADTRIALILGDADQSEDCVRQLVRIGYDKVIGYTLFRELSGTPEVMRGTRTIDLTTVDANARILDVRSDSEFAEAHIPGALNVPHNRLVADRSDLPPVGKITVHCGSGVRAAIASAALERMGYAVTYADGKFSDWRKHADKVETGS